jgi:RND family efflux transporter MFP subunit
MNFKKILMYALALIVLCGSGLVWSELQKPREKAPAQNAAEFVSATGRVESRSEAVVRAKGAGRIVKYLKHEGDWAESGAVVVLLDQDMESAALREAQAQLFQSESVFRRTKVLHDEKVAADQEFDDADGAYRLALARRDKAQAALDERTIRAPFAGRILKTYLEEGESIDARTADTPLFVIGDTRALRVRAEVDEQDIGRLSAGGEARVSADAFPGEVFPGKVASVSGIIGRKKLRSDDPRERMDAKVLEVMIDLPASSRLRPGITVEVKIDAGAEKSS